MSVPINNWGFNAHEVDPTLAIPQLPIGRHTVQITKTEVVATSGGDGGMLRVHVQLQQGGSGAINLNLWNQNTQAVEIARRTLSAICHAAQTFNLSAQPPGVELVGKIMIINVSAQTKGEGAEKGYTQVDGYFDLQGNSPTATRGAQGNPAPQFAGQPAQAQPQQPAQPSFAPAGQAQPSFGQATQAAQPQPGQPAQGGAPSWGSPGMGGQPQQPAQPAQPAQSWQGQPPASGPSWGR